MNYPSRSGVSLLEVLISIFVLSLGLLGVAAVIPVGGHEILEAVKADRAAACGQSVLHDMKVSRMLNLGEWLRVDPNNPGGPLIAIGAINPYTQLGAYTNEHRGYLSGESYAIDSLYMAANASANRMEFTDFPYNPRTPGTPIGVGWTRLQRVTWSRAGLNPALARAIYEWRDDLVIPSPDDETQRPELLMVRDTGGNPLMGENAGHYTYLVTVTPSTENIDFVNDMGPNQDNLPYTYTESTPQYTVSVVVFYRRDMTVPSGFGADQTPGERQVMLKFVGGGYGGGDVLLSLLPSDSISQAPYLDIKENEWLMVSGGYLRSAPFQNPGMPLPQDYPLMPVGVHKWYRILATGDTVVEQDTNFNGRVDPEEDLNGNGVFDPPYRDATLAGPDWNPFWALDLDGDPNTPPAEALATLVKGAVGVYTKTIEFDW